jgi:hypothetical protein
VAAAQDCAAAQRIADDFGHRMRLVSILGPDAVVKRDLREAYGSLVTAKLLSDWQATPSKAPGREVSNPWPVRIDVRSAQRDGEDCRVDGDAVFVTTSDTTKPVERRPVTIRVNMREGRINAFEITKTTARTPASVVRDYYDAIQARDYDRAFALWGNGGTASGKTRTEFAAGFAQTQSVRVTIGDSTRVEGAAGSQYATLPVTVDAVLRSGEDQHFEGTYTLRRAMVDGATPEQRAWHIYTAKLRQL